MAELHIRLPENVMKIAKEEAAEMGLSAAKWIAFLVVAYVNSDKKAQIVMLNGEKP